MIENLRFLSEFSLRFNKRVILIIQLHTQTYSITSFNIDMRFRIGFLDSVLLFYFALGPINNILSKFYGFIQIYCGFKLVLELKNFRLNNFELNHFKYLKIMYLIYDLE